MKSAVEEIREALQASRCWFSSAFANVQITVALDRLHDLEKQIAEAVETTHAPSYEEGRKQGRLDVLRDVHRIWKSWMEEDDVSGVDAFADIAGLFDLKGRRGNDGEVVDAAEREIVASALGRLDELEKQIAEAEERGRDEAFGVLHSLREALPTISGGIRHHAFKARESFREVERALCHYDTRAAARAKEKP